MLYDIVFTERSLRRFKYWDLFFVGWDEGSYFVWQLKPELAKALKECDLTGELKYAEDLPVVESLSEGARKTVTVNSYERNPKARQRCIEHWGLLCSVCEFDFYAVYGELGSGYIHVHHLTPVSEIGEKYQVDPIEDLRPVCPNCHSMLHSKNPSISLYELKEIVTINRKRHKQAK